MTGQFAVTPRSRIRRLPARGSYDRETIYRIVDEALYCTVAFVEDGLPFAIPINHARSGDTLLLHGAPASRLLKQVQTGGPLCVTVTLVDGLVLARAAFHHSMNYRSAVLFGRGRLVTDSAEKLAALEAVSEHLVPGRWAEVRRPTARELNATTVVAVEIESASAKVRSGPPIDDEEDYTKPIWAGVLPVREEALTPEPDPRLSQSVPVPDHVAKHRRRRAG